MTLLLNFYKIALREHNSLRAKGLQGLLRFDPPEEVFPVLPEREELEDDDDFGEWCDVPPPE